MNDPTFLTFLESEITDEIKICLDYFFAHDGRNRYKFSIAYTKYTKLGDDTFITPRRYFNIVRSTSLVSDQLVFRQQTTRGFHYLIQKKFFSLATRHNRQITRQNTRTSPPTFKPNEAVNESKSESPTNSDSTTSFTEIPTLNNHNSNDGGHESPTIIGTPSGSESSIDSLSIGDTWESTNQMNRTTSPADDRSQINTPTSVVSPVPEDISPTVTKITKQMNRDIKQTITAVREADSNDNNHLKISTRQYIDAEVQRLIDEKATHLQGLEDKVSRMEKLFDDIQTSKENLDTLEDQYKKGSERSIDGYIGSIQKWKSMRRNSNKNFRQH